MKRKTEERIKLAAIIVSAVLAIGTIVGFISSLSGVSIGKSRNKDNLITLDCIEAAGVEPGEAKKSSVSDVTVEISDKGVVKLTGTASADDTFVYAQVKLPAGTYRFRGAENSTSKTYELFMTDGMNSYESDGNDVIVVTEEKTFSIEIRIYEDCNFGIFGTKLYPVIWKVADSDDKTVVEFWK